MTGFFGKSARYCNRRSASFQPSPDQIQELVFEILATGVGRQPSEFSLHRSAKFAAGHPRGAERSFLSRQQIQEVDDFAGWSACGLGMDRPQGHSDFRGEPDLRPVEGAQPLPEFVTLHRPRTSPDLHRRRNDPFILGQSICPRTVVGFRSRTFDLSFSLSAEMALAQADSLSIASRSRKAIREVIF